MAPVVYKDIHKSAKDLLSNDYCFDKKFKLSTKTANGVGLTTEGTLGDKGVDAKITGKFTVDNVSVDKLSVTTAGRFGVEASIKDIPAKSIKTALKFEDGLAGSGNGVGVATFTYSKDRITGVLELDLINGPTVYASGVGSYNKFLLGADLKYNTQLADKAGSPTLKDAGCSVAYVDAGLSVAAGASGFGKNVTLSVHHSVDPSTSVAAQFDFEPKGAQKMMTIGGTRKIDNETSFTAKVDSNGIASANWIQVVRPEVKVIASTSIDAKNFAGDKHKFGLQLILG